MSNHPLTGIITLGAVVVLVVRGLHLRRPITAAHALIAALMLLGGLGVYLLRAGPVGAPLIIAGAVALFWPVSSRPDHTAVHQVWQLINQTHGDPLAPFALSAQKSYFLTPDSSAAIAYRARLGLAVVSGDPLGCPDRFADLVTEFAAMCHSMGWRVVVLGSSDGLRGLWQKTLRRSAIRSTLRAVPIGCDVEVDVQHFAMTGRRFRNLRQAVSRTHNRGITTEVVDEQHLDEHLTAELVEVLHSSHHAARYERGFSMILDSALEGRYPGVVLMIGRDAAGVVQGFHRYLIAGAGSDVTLDVPWRRPGAPNGIDERLTVDMISRCKAAGTQRLSLAFAAFPDLFEKTDRTMMENVYYRLITLGGPLIRLESLYRYLRKFHALGEKRYVLVSVRHIPLALIVLLSLEFTPRRRRLGPLPGR